MLLGLMPAGCATQAKVEVIDEAGFANVLKQHRGTVILVDFWATWCTECMDLFPHTVELHKRLADRGLTVISVSLDDPGDAEVQAAVRKFLDQHGATFQNFVSKYGSTSESFEVFDIPDGALPHFKLYDREGKLYKTFASGGQNIDPDEIDRAVEALLGKT